MLHQRERQEEARPDDEQDRRSARFEIVISSNGSVALNGELLPVPEGQQLHVAVLDAVHRDAQDRGSPVDATVLDLRENGYATYIRVFPDGTSRLLVHGGENAPVQDDDEDVLSHGDEDVPSPAPRGDAAPAPEPSAADAASEPSDVKPPDPDPDPDPDPGPGSGPAPEGPWPEPAAVPAELADVVAHINRAADAGELERAAVLAFRLREHAARSYGEEHPYTLEARDLEAFVARLGGHYAKATETYLELAHLCHQQGIPRAYGYLKHAAGNWQLLTDPQALLAHGKTLLATWAALAAEAGPAAHDTALPRHVRRRLQALTGTASRQDADGDEETS